uniref:Uncharacterized protein n=1 Tax=Piliocolobus tephrosceles TaxID=591936 RepID=A0A8C9HCL1_9PRIM
MGFTMLAWFAFGGKNWQLESSSLISKGNPDFFVNYVRQVVYGFLYELQFTVHQILVSEELIYVKCLKSLYLKIK